MTGAALMRLAARTGLVLAVLLPLLLASDVSHADLHLPSYRDDYWPECNWWELERPGRHYITYDSSPSMPWWTSGAAEWDYAMDPVMRFYYVSWPGGQTALRWEGDEPAYHDCPLPDAVACWQVVQCSGGQMLQAVIYFDYDNYLALDLNDRIATSGHEWGHGVNLGHHDPPRNRCDQPPRIMGYVDGEGCITGPSPAEAWAVAEFYGWGGVDRDGDEFVDSKEVYLTTDPLDNCPDNPSDDAWPLDINMDTYITVTGDVLNFNGRIGASEGAPNWWVRLDLNVDGWITTTGDVLMYRGKVGESCY